MMEKQKNIPVLRFPEFEGEWEKKRLGDVTTKVGSGSTPLGGEKSYQSDGVVFIRSQNVNNDALNLHDVVYISEAINKKMEGSQVTANDILLNITGASIGRSCVVPSDFKIGNVNQHVSIIRLIEKFTPYFLQPLLSSAKGQKLISESQAGGGREGLNFQNIRSFKIYFPTLPEQQKIATFFTAIDQKISQLKKKHQLLEQYKKGVMQQIFSQQIRFKDDDGREFPKWEKKRLGSIADLYQPKTISQSELTLKGYLVYGANGIIGHYSKFNHETEQIAITCRGSTCGFVNYTKPNSWITGNAMVVNVDLHRTINKKFLYFQLCRTDLRYLISGSGQPQITGNIKKHKVLIPTLTEQTKIANFLSAIDEKIHHTRKQIEQAKQWKKGLMQKMFV